MRLQLILEVEPREEARDLISRLLGQAPTARELAAVLVLVKPRVKLVRGRTSPAEGSSLCSPLPLAGEGKPEPSPPLALPAAGTRPAGRHRWVRNAVEVPWSAAPASLYTCRACGTTRQSIPPIAAGGRWTTEYRLPDWGGTSEVLTSRPSCPGPERSRDRLDSSRGALRVDLRIRASQGIDSSHAARLVESRLWSALRAIPASLLVRRPRRLRCGDPNLPVWAGGSR